MKKLAGPKQTVSIYCKSVNIKFVQKTPGDSPVILAYYIPMYNVPKIIGVSIYSTDSDFHTG